MSIYVDNLIKRYRAFRVLDENTKAYWAHFRREENYIFRELTRNFCELTRKFRV